MSELTKRVLFAIVAIPVVGAAVWFGGAALATLLAVASALAAWEYCNMSQVAGAAPLTGWTVVLAALLPLAAHAARLGYTLPPLSLVAMIVPLVLTAALWRRAPTERPLFVVATTLFGAIYTGGMLAFVYALRYHRFTVDALGGTLLVALPVVLTWINDTGAYFVGKRFGTTKLMPSVSPGKTWAGAWGALASTVLATWLIVTLVLGPLTRLGMPLWGVVLYGVVLSVAAQVGDLAESLLKRDAGVKDSSHLIPGHGGVLDRVDSLLFTVPITYVMLEPLLTTSLQVGR